MKYFFNRTVVSILALWVPVMAWAQTPAPANDNFASATLLSGATGSLTGSTNGATVETGEPVHHTSNSARASIWYRLTPTAAGVAEIDTIGSSFDTVLAIYTGTSVDSLTRVASDDDSGGSGNTSRIRLNVAAGTTYSIAIDGYGTSKGNTVLRWAVARLPVVTGAPVNQTAVLGGSASFSVTASGEALTYQWYHDGVAIAGATSATLTVSPVSLTDGGAYVVTVSNLAGVVSTAPVTLSGANPVPTIATPPADLAVVAGQPATFSVTATGTGTLTYQWRRNGFAIAGATAASFTLPTTSRTDADYYDVQVADGLSVATSAAARLDVTPSGSPGLLAIDPSWNVALESPNIAVNKVLPVASGKFLVAGDFIKVNGHKTGDVARFNADGTVDTTFVAPVLDGYAKSLALQADGKVVVGGSFSVTSSSLTRSNLIRLNPDGTLDSTFNAGGGGPNGWVAALAIDASGHIYVGGGFGSYNGTGYSNLARLNADGSLDQTYAPSINSTVLALGLMTDGKAVIGGDFSTVAGVARNRVARLNADGTLDTTFDPGSGPGSDVLAVAVTADGKVYLGGWFSTYNGTNVARYLRLNADGSLDSTFVTSNFGGNQVETLAVQTDGTVLIGGSFYTVRGISRSNLVRLTTDGSVDVTLPQNYNSTVMSVAVAADGQILAGGSFTTVGSASRQRVARIGVDGVLDAGVAPTIVQQGNVRAMALVPGGKLAIAGEFATVNGVARNNVAQLNADGSLDLSFDPGTGASSTATAILRQADGKLLLAGNFSQFNGQSRSGLVRLLANGSLDASFTATSLPTGITVIAAGKGGALAIAFGQTNYNFTGGVTRSWMARLNPDGSLDQGFAPAPNSSVAALAFQANGRLLLGGYFTAAGGATWGQIARLNSDGTADSSFVTGSGFGGNQVSAVVTDGGGKIWAGGSFYSYNGASRYFVARILEAGGLDGTFGSPAFGNGTSSYPAIVQILPQNDGKVIVAGGFNAPSSAPATRYLARLNADGTTDASFGSSLTLPVQAVAQGDDSRLYVATSYAFGRLTTASVPTITAGPVSATANAGGTVTFSVTASGLPAPSYQWTFNGAGITGATAATLTLTNVQLAQAGQYAVIVSNTFGSVASAPATLSGANPIPTIATPPADLAVVAGQPATFSVTATGTGTLTYQWRRNGFPIAGATTASFTIPTSSRTDADYYDVVVADGLSVATSASARLDVGPASSPGFQTIDPTWNLALETGNVAVNKVLPLVDGKFLVAGDFIKINGHYTGDVARFNADGTIDPTFVAPVLDGYAKTLAVQPDGKVLVGGSFTVTNDSTTYARLIRLNTDGSFDATFNPGGSGPNYDVWALSVATDGRIYVAGGFSSYNGTVRSYLARLGTDGALDATFSPVVGGTLLAMGLQADGKIVISGYFTTVSGLARNRVARLNADGTLDPTFDPGTGPSDSALALAVAADGKVYLGGRFSTYNGTSVARYLRLNADGSLDSTFVTSNFSGNQVETLAMQTDGKVLIGGSFYTVRGVSRSNLVRLATDGSIDATLPQNYNSTVMSVAVAADGQILAGGYFTTVDSTSRQRVARIRADATLDAAVNLAIRQQGNVRAIALVPGGKLAIAGDFTTVNGVARNNVAQLNADGSLDLSFDPGTGANSNTSSILRQADGKLLLAGNFYQFNGQAKWGLVRLLADGGLDSSFTGTSLPMGITTMAVGEGGAVTIAFSSSSYSFPGGATRSYVARLKADGSLDTGFNPTPNGDVYALALQADGKIVLAGYFSSISGTAWGCIARLNRDGTADPSFATGNGFDSQVSTLATVAGGKIWAGGYFSNYNGTSRYLSARILGSGGVDSTYTSPAFDGWSSWSITQVVPLIEGRLLVGGGFNALPAAPATRYLARVNADGSVDPSFGSDLTSVVRAAVQDDDGRIYVATGNAFGRLIAATAPVMTTQPVSQTVTTGSDVVLRVEVSVVGSVSYRWTHDGVTVAGATGATLRLPAVDTGDAGDYVVTVTSRSGAGSATSAVAHLTVNGPPTITAQTPWQKVFAGNSATFTANAAAAASYLWQRSTDGGATWSTLTEGATFSGVASATLTVGGVNAGMSGWLFRATITNSYGSVTSDPANLSLVVKATTPSLAWLAGGNSTILPVRSPKAIIGGVADFSAGSSHSMVLKADGSLWTTGSNSFGQLGDGTTTNRNRFVQVATGAAKVAAGGSHSMFIKSDGTLWGMGSNSSGQLGDGTTITRLTPVQVSGGTNVTAVAVGADHTLFLKSDGTLWGMGANGNGQLGDGTTNQHSTPVQISSEVTAVAGGTYSNSSYFIKSDGTLWSVGSNYAGQLGDGTKIVRRTPVQVATGVAQVTAAGNVLMFIKTDGTLWASGYDYNGTQGDGTTNSRLAPVQIASDVAQVSAGGSVTLFIKTDASLWGLGDNSTGALADPAVTGNHNIPVQVARGVTKVSAGGTHTLFTRSDGVLRAVGDASAGALGDGQIAGIAPLATDAISVAASGYSAPFVLAAKSDGTLWRQRDGGALSQVPGVSDVVEVYAGGYDYRWLYLKRDGTLWRLANDNTSKQVASNVLSAGAGLNYTVYLKNDGTLWGEGAENGDTAIRFGDGVSPTQVADHVLSVAASGWHILFVRDDHTLWGMGWPWGGFSPVGSAAERFMPVQVETGVAWAAATSWQNLFYKTDGTLWTRGAGWSDWNGPVAQVDSDVVGAAVGYYLKADGILRFRMGQSGTLGVVEQIASGVTSVQGNEFGAVYLQTAGFGSLPTITLAPQAAAPALGAALTLTATATGSGPIGYQWAKDGVTIPWAQAAQLTIPYAEASDAGAYTVTVTNSAGSVTSGVANVTVGGARPVVLDQPVAQRAVLGSRVIFQVSASDITGVSYQWLKDGSNLPGATAATLVLDPVAATDAASYSVALTNGGGTTTSATATLTVLTPDSILWQQTVANNPSAEYAPGRTIHDGQGGIYLPWTIYSSGFDMVGAHFVGQLVRVHESDGTLDPAFRLDRRITRAAFAAVQADHKVVIAANVGDLETVVRVDAAGALDPTFHAPTFGFGVRFVTIQSDGKMLVAATNNIAAATPAGTVTAGMPAVYRLNTDGSLDSSFAPAVLTNGGTVFGPPVIDATGRIYLVGSFTTINSTSRPAVVRLSSAGVIDTSFANPSTLPAGFVAGTARSLALQSDGRAVVVGDFRYTARGTSADRIMAIRFNTDGTFDSSFAQPLRSQIGVSAGLRLRYLVMLSDDKFVAVSNHLVRFNADGSPDATFSSRELGIEGFWLSRSSDGRYFVPNENSVAGQALTVPIPGNGVATFDADGTPNYTFQTGGWGRAAFPTSANVLSDGRVVLGGQFNRFGGRTLPGVATFAATGAGLAANQPALPTLAGGVGTPSAVVAPAGDDQTYIIQTDLTADSGNVSRLLRIKANGSVDAAFVPQLPSTFAADNVDLFAAPDGKVILAALELSATQALSGATADSLVRLNADGSRDAGFVSALTSLGQVERDGSNHITRITLRSARVLQTLADGRLLVLVSGPDGTLHLQRLTAAGAIDASFTTPSLGTLVASQGYTGLIVDPVTQEQSQFNLTTYGGASLVRFACQMADGRVYVGGDLSLSGAPRGLVRLNSDGTLDSSFAGVGAAFDATPFAIGPTLAAAASDTSGRLYVAGRLDHFNGVAVPGGLFRLNVDGSVDSTWIPGLAVMDYPALDVRLVRRGNQLYVFGTVGATNDAYPGVYRIITIDPDFLTQPSAQNVAVGGSATFTVSMIGTAPFTYQWKKDGTAITGATSATLTLSNVRSIDAGNYTVVATNSHGSVESRPAALTVSAPTFSSYLSQNFTTLELADSTVGGTAADPDADGLSNLAEYALGQNPKSNDQSGQPVIGTDSGKLTLTYTKRNDVADLTYTVEATSDLATSWTSGAGVTEQLSSTVIDATHDRIVVRDLTALSSVPRRFLRLKIVLASPATGVVSPPLGAVNLTFATGKRLTGMPLVNAASARGRVASHTGTTVTLANIADVGARLSSAAAYFVEITGGPATAYIGERFEVDVAATKTAANGAVTIVASSPRNTLATLPAANALAGCTVAIRPHVTLGQLFGSTGTTPMFGSTISSSADQIQLLNPQTQSFEIYYLLRNGTGTIEQWTKVGAGATNQASAPIASGTGMVVVRNGATPVSLAWLGEVRQNGFAQPVVAGNNLVSQPFPVEHSPVGRLMTFANGFTGSTIASSADQVQVYVSGAFQVYYLLRNGTGTIEQWTKVGGGGTNYNQTALIGADAAVVVRKIVSDPNYFVPLPAALQP